MMLWAEPNIGDKKMSYVIQYEGDSEQDDYEFYMKGYRYVTVLVDENRYRLFIVSFPRLYQEFIGEIEYKGMYIAEPNTFLVTEISRKEIEKLIRNLYEAGVFRNLGTSQEYCDEKADFSNAVSLEHDIQIIYGGKKYEKQGIVDGYRDDVSVIVKNKEYRLHITNIARLYYDFMVAVEKNEVFCPKYNLLVVKEAYSTLITDVVKTVYKDGFFDNLVFN